jgi:hypothetical protein
MKFKHVKFEPLRLHFEGRRKCGEISVYLYDKT